MTKKSKRLPIVEIRFPTGDTISLVESEKAEIMSAARLALCDNEELREAGEARIEELAKRLARERDRSMRERLGRIEIGEGKAQLVKRLISEGKDPLAIASERTVRRVKRRR